MQSCPLVIGEKRTEGPVCISARGCSLKTGVGFLALENTELNFVSTSGCSCPEWVMPSLIHHTRASFLCSPIHLPLWMIDLSFFLSSWHLSCSRIRSFSDITHRHVQFCLVKKALEQSRSFSLCWKALYSRAPGGGLSRHLHHRHGAPLWLKKYMWVGD